MSMAFMSGRTGHVDQRSNLVAHGWPERFAMNVARAAFSARSILTSESVTSRIDPQ